MDERGRERKETPLRKKVGKQEKRILHQQGLGGRQWKGDEEPLAEVVVGAGSGFQCP